MALGVGASARPRHRNFRAGVVSKTTLTLAIIASAQSFGGTAAFVDADMRRSGVRGKLGVKVNDLLVSQPIPAEQGLEITTCWWRSARWM